MMQKSSLSNLAIDAATQAYFSEKKPVHKPEIEPFKFFLYEENKVRYGGKISEMLDMKKSRERID